MGSLLLGELLIKTEDKVAKENAVENGNDGKHELRDEIGIIEEVIKNHEAREDENPGSLLGVLVKISKRVCLLGASKAVIDHAAA